jgi:threonine dehydrogenase-like Zn-dependent dehydrogenase
MEASPGHGQGGLVSVVKEKVMPAERTYVLDQAIKAVRPCGVVSVPGVYGGPVSVNMGSIVQKGLRLCSGQTHVKRYLEPLTKLIQGKKVDMACCRFRRQAVKLIQPSFRTQPG